MLARELLTENASLIEKKWQTDNDAQIKFAARLPTKMNEGDSKVMASIMTTYLQPLLVLGWMQELKISIHSEIEIISQLDEDGKYLVVTEIRKE